MNALLTYFNEHDKFAANWLRNLFPEANVDDRDIQNVSAADVAGFRRCHFFGGIGGWELALQLADWPSDREVWTGSCPCQPLSCAGKRAGEKDERHLWPEFYRLISECRPATIFGEQVASNDGLEWLDGISLDLEELGYAVAAGDLPAASQNAPQGRQRFWWGAIGLEHANNSRREEAREPGQSSWLRGLPGPRRGIERLGDSDESRLGSRWPIEREPWGEVPTERISSDGMANCNGQRLPFGSESDGETEEFLEQASRRADSPRCSELRCATAVCRDGKFRRVPTEPSFQPLAYGIPRDLGRRFPELRSLAKSARTNRVGRLKGYGNAIVPQVAATFIRAFMESYTSQPPRET